MSSLLVPCRDHIPISANVKRRNQARSLPPARRAPRIPRRAVTGRRPSSGAGATACAEAGLSRVRRLRPCLRVRGVVWPLTSELPADAARSRARQRRSLPEATPARVSQDVPPVRRPRSPVSDPAAPIEIALSHAEDLPAGAPWRWQRRPPPGRGQTRSSLVASQVELEVRPTPA
jgi:hypothetical protein